MSTEVVDYRANPSFIELRGILDEKIKALESAKTAWEPKSGFAHILAKVFMCRLDAGDYSNSSSTSATPKKDLVDHLTKMYYLDLARRASAGEFDF